MGCCASIPQPDTPRDNAPVRSNDASANVSAAGGGANGQQDPRAAQASLSAPNVNAARSPAGGGADGVSGGNAAVPAGSSKKSNGGAGGGGGLSPQARFEIQPGPPLGKGHFAVVRKCRDTLTGKMCAVKIIDKKEMVKSTASVVKQEIEILKAVGSHPNIVQLIDHWEDATRHYLVLQLCEGGDLFSQIVEHGKYSEKDAVKCCRQLAEALKHIHACGITHRDLKPENVLLESKDPNSLLKLADFGLSKLIKGHLHPMRTVCGTWAYCVAEDTWLRCRKSSTSSGDGALQRQSGKQQLRNGVIRARDVSTRTQLLDEFGHAVAVKAIHTTTRSVAPLWRVLDADTGALLFRCTADHKLSFLHSHSQSDEDRRRAQQQHQFSRVEVRCSDYAAMESEAQQRLLAYVASSQDEEEQSPYQPQRTRGSDSTRAPLPPHVSRTLRVRVEAPRPDAPLERFVGIEVASKTHRFQLAAPDDDEEIIGAAPSELQHRSSRCSRSSASFGLVTSNCAPEVIQRRPYDSSVDRWTLGVLMYILLSGYHPFDVFGDCAEPELLNKIMACEYDFDDPIWGCFDEDTQLLTNEGFMFGREIRERMARKEEKQQQLQFACYDTAFGQLIYRPAVNNALSVDFVHPPVQGLLVDFTPQAEQQRWTMATDSSNNSNSVTNEKSTTAAPHSNGVSMRVTHNHTMFAQWGTNDGTEEGAVNVRRHSHTTSGVEGDEVAHTAFHPAGGPLRADFFLPHAATTPAEQQQQQHPQPEGLRFMAYAEHGVHRTEAEHADALALFASLGLEACAHCREGTAHDLLLPLNEDDDDIDDVPPACQVLAFVELYGFWLRNGTLTPSHADCPSRVAFGQLEQDWLARQFSACGLTSDEWTMLTAEGEAGLLRDSHVARKSWNEWIVQEHGLEAINAVDDVVAVAGATTTKKLLLTHQTVAPILHRVLGKEQLRWLLRGLCRASANGGSVLLSSSSSKFVSTSSASFRDELMVLALHAGYSAHFTQTDDEEEEAHPGAVDGPSWTVHLADSETEGKTGKATTSSDLLLPSLSTSTDVREVAYEGKVWCVTVDHPDHLVVARRAVRNASGDLITHASRPIIIGQSISSEAKGLIKRLLVLDPKKRLSIDEYLASPWIRGSEPVSQDVNPLVLERLSKFGVGNKFRALVVAKMASNKFKASISRSKGGKKANVGLLPDGTPDYLGLYSERNGTGTPMQNSARGLESVREGRNGGGGGGGAATGGTASPNGAHIAQFEPSAGLSSVGGHRNGNGAGGGIVSINGLDLVSTTRRGGASGGGAGGAGHGVSVDALNDGVLMLHGGAGGTAGGSPLGGGGGGGADDTDTDTEWATMRDSDGEMGGNDLTPLPRSSRAGSAINISAGPASAQPSATSTPVARTEGLAGITVAANGAAGGSGGGVVDRPKGGLTGHRSDDRGRPTTAAAAATAAFGPPEVLVGGAGDHNDDD